MKTANTKLQKSEKRPAETPAIPVLEALGQNLKRYRQAANKTQIDLAYDAEVERSRISKIERGHVNPSLLTLATLCYSLGITLPILFEGITATMPPIGEGGTPRRANQATLEPIQRLTKRKFKN